MAVVRAGADIYLYAYNRTTGKFYNQYDTYLYYCGYYFYLATGQTSTYYLTYGCDVNVTETGCYFSNHYCSPSHTGGSISFGSTSCSRTDVRFRGVATATNSSVSSLGPIIYQPNSGAHTVRGSAKAMVGGGYSYKYYYAIYSEDWDITKHLSHTTLSNSAAWVQYDKSYTTTLEASSSDYILDDDSVVVKMGDVDITSDVYNKSTHTITIPKATADISITATSRFKKEYLLKIKGIYRKEYSDQPITSVCLNNVYYPILQFGAEKSFYIIDDVGDSHQFNFLDNMTFRNFYYSDFNTDEKFSISNDNLYYDGDFCDSLDTRMQERTYRPWD